MNLNRGSSGQQSKLRENQREALLVLEDVLDLKRELHTLHRTMQVEASARVMCFADAVGANVVAKYHSRRRDTFNHMPNAGNATLMVHVVLARI